MKMGSWRLRLCAGVAVLAAAMAATAEAQNGGVRNNANNTLGAFGFNRGRILLGDLRRQEFGRHDGVEGAAPTASAAFGSGLATFGADDIRDRLEKGEPIEFHASGAEIGSVGIWAAGGYTHYESRYGTIGSEGYVAQTQLGMDVLVSDGILLGLLLHADFLDADTDHLNPALGPIETASEGFLVGPYAMIGLSDAIHLEGLAAIGIVANDYRWKNVPTNEYNSERLLMMARISGDWSLDNWSFRPESRVIYYAERREAFTDHTGNVFDEDTSALGQVRFGGEIGYDLGGEGGVLRPFVGGEGVWAFSQDQLLMAGRLITPNELSAAFSAGLDASLGAASLRAAARYDGAGAEDFDAVTGELQLRVPLN